MSTDPLPPTILVQQPDGSKAKAVLLRWPVNDLPVYAVAEPSENQDEVVFSATDPIVDRWVCAADIQG